jgi:hypothetical protein
VSFLKKLRDAEAEAVPQDTDPWRLRLERLRGKVDFDGMERVPTQHLLDVLELPQRERTAGAYRHLAKLMTDLGWTAVRLRDLTRGGYKEQVRGYCRDARLSDKSNREHKPADGAADSHRWRHGEGR